MQWRSPAEQTDSRLEAEVELELELEVVVVEEVEMEVEDVVEVEVELEEDHYISARTVARALIFFLSGS